MKNNHFTNSSQELEFNLFNLDSDQDLPNSWLWCCFNPKIIKQVYLKKLESKNQKRIVLIISNKLNCGKSTIEKHLINLKNSGAECLIPIKVLKELTNYLDPRLIILVNDSITSIFCTNQYSREVKAVKSLSIELAEFMGAFVADGYFHQHKGDYYFKISEGNKETLLVLKQKIQKAFGFEARLTESKPDNVWNLWIKNKVICRYFENLFEFKPGKKAEIVRMPNLIKNSSFEIQRAFVRGVFTFDGCVKTNGNVAFCTRSKNLVEDIKSVLDKEGIQYSINYNKNKNAWNLESSSGRNKELLWKWREYFFPGTIKYQRLNFFLGESKKDSFEELEKIFSNHPHNIASLKEIYQAINNIQKCEINDIVTELNKNNLNLAKTTLYKYLHILTASKLINKENYPIKTSKNGFIRTVYSVEGRDLITQEKL